MRKDAVSRAAPPTRREPAEVERWCSTFEARCRERGIRLTPQRQAVYRVLAADLSHPTAETVHANLRAALPTLSLATVYRILESFEARGLVRKVSTTEGAGRFDANVEAHQHLFCRICGRMSDWREESLSEIEPPADPAGFQVEGLDIRIVGVCQECAPRPSKRRGEAGGRTGRH